MSSITIKQAVTTTWVPIAAVLPCELAQMERGLQINDQYFLRPLFYQDEQQVGEDA